MQELLKIVTWPVTTIVVLLIFKHEIGIFIKSLNLKEIVIPERLKLIFSRQYQVTKEYRNNKNYFFEELYQKMTGAQLRFLFVLKESMKLGGRGMDCGYVSNYFQNIIKSKTDKYDGWITPFITAYLQENGLVTVADNFFRINKIGEDFLSYVESKAYKISDKEL